MAKAKTKTKKTKEPTRTGPGKPAGFGKMDTSNSAAGGKAEELVNLIAFDENYVELRFIGTPLCITQYKFEQGKGSDRMFRMRNANNFDDYGARTSKTSQYVEADLPYEGIQQYFFVNCIVRKWQDQGRKDPGFSKSELKSGVLSKQTNNTFVKVARLTPTMVKKLKALGEMNKYKNDSYDILDPIYGRNVSIMYEKKGGQFGSYEIQTGDRAAITKKEAAYPLWDLSVLKDKPVENIEADIKKLQKDFGVKGKKKKSGKK